MKFNNKILGIVFLGLISLYFFQKTYNKPSERSFKEVLVEVDTASINKIIFFPKGDVGKIVLTKNAGRWQADNGIKNVNATPSSIQAFLAPVTKIKAEQLISKNASKWVDYEVDDVNGKKIELYNGDKVLSSFYVGRFNFNQNTRSAKSYMRLANENDIYVVDGFLSMTYEKQFDDFRNKKLVNNILAAKVSSLSVQSQESDFKIEKDMSNNWIGPNDASLDSIAVMNVVNAFINMTGNEIDDNFIRDETKHLAKISLNSDKDEVQVIDIYNKGDNEFILVGSSNNEVFFESDSTGLFKKAYLEIKDLVD